MNNYIRFEKIDDEKHQNDEQNDCIIIDTSYINRSNVHNSLDLYFQ